MGVACLEFRGENFRGWRKNREIRESFLPRKFPAIRYYPADSVFDTNILLSHAICPSLCLIVTKKIQSACILSITSLLVLRCHAPGLVAVNEI